MKCICKTQVSNLEECPDNIAHIENANAIEAERKMLNALKKLNETIPLRDEPEYKVAQDRCNFPTKNLND